MNQRPDPARQLSYRDIFIFWAPLGLMWFMMAAEQPTIAAFIARMPQANTNLAAFGLVFAMALVAESPIIQILSAATALAANRQNYRTLMRFMGVMSIVLTALHLLVALTPLFDLIVQDVMGVPESVAQGSRVPFIIMAPFTAAVGYRRLWQGVLIRHGKTWIVPVSMIARLGTLVLILATGFSSWTVSGAMLASIAMVAAVVVAAVVAGILNYRLVLPALSEPESSADHLSTRDLLKFYVPLALTTVVYLLANPVLTSGIARGKTPELSLAVWPVVTGLTFLFTSVAMSYQEAAIALLKRTPRSRPRLFRFTVGLSLALASLMVIAAITPIGDWWFRRVSGLTEELLPLTRVPMLILALVPGFVAFKAWFRALFVASGRTGVLAQGVVVYTIVLFVLMFTGSAVLSVAGATIAAVAMSIGQLSENLYLVARHPNRG